MVRTFLLFYYLLYCDLVDTPFRIQNIDVAYIDDGQTLVWICANNWRNIRNLIKSWTFAFVLLFPCNGCFCIYINCMELNYCLLFSNFTNLGCLVPLIQIDVYQMLEPISFICSTWGCEYNFKMNSGFRKVKHWKQLHWFVVYGLTLYMIHMAVWLTWIYYDEIYFIIFQHKRNHTK